MTEPADRYRRQQRRRAAIAWLVAVPFLALFVVGLIVGGSAEEETGAHPDLFGYSMTAAQYAGLQPGLDQSAAIDRLEQTGLPEYFTKDRYVRLFPPHRDGVHCSYWEISDRFGTVARVCFANADSRLVEKLRRQAAAAGEFGDRV